MKKFLPAIVLVMGFCGFLALQIGNDLFHLNAQQVSPEKEKHQLFESLYKELKLTTIKGETLELKTVKSPMVLVNFWASWCLPCIKEFPSLVEFQKKYGDRLTVVGINGDEEEPEKAIEKTKAKYQLNFHHVIDPQSVISDKFLVTTYPFSLIYVNGKVAHITNKGHDFMDKDFLAKIDQSLTSK
jgi:thiol-disulfide isomerase/thioredoxin